MQLSQRILHYAAYLLLPRHCTIKNNHKIKERNVMPCTLPASLADAAIQRLGAQVNPKIVLSVLAAKLG